MSQVSGSGRRFAIRGRWLCCKSGYLDWRDSATALGIVKRYLLLPFEAVAIAKALELKEREAAKERQVSVGKKVGRIFGK